MKSSLFLFLAASMLLFNWPLKAAEGGGYTMAGLQGQYFANTNLFGPPAFVRRDVRLDFAMNSLPPGGAGQTGDIGFRSVPANEFSVQWSGQLIPRFTENYTFKVLAADSFTLRLRPGGTTAWTTVINQTTYTGASSTGSLALTAGTAYDVQAILVHGSGPWAAQLSWSSPSTPGEVIDPLVDCGINNPDWTAGFADIVKGAGRNTWQGLNAYGSVDWGNTQALDGFGWPTADGAYIFQESLNEGLGIDPLMRGLVTFSFQPIISLPAHIGSGQFQMIVNRVAGQNYTVQMSTNLASPNWMPLLTTNPASGSFLFSDPKCNQRQPLSPGDDTVADEAAGILNT